MKGKKIFGIGAAVLLVTLVFSSTVYSGSENEGDEEFKQALSEFVEDNLENLETIGGFLLDASSDYNFGQPLPVLPEELEMIINDLIIEFQQIILNYYGRCAYYESNDSAQFLIDEGDTNFYFGHCWASCKAMVGVICDIFLRYSVLILIIATIFIALIPIFGFIYAYILILIIIPKWEEIKEIFERLKNHPYGVVLFYFDREDKILRIWDELRGFEQPGDPNWNPTWFYNQTEWITLVEY